MTFTKALLFVGLAASAFAQTPLTLNFTATAALTGTTSYAFSGTASITGLGTAALSGAGALDGSLLSGGTTGVIPGSFTMIFPDGAVMVGTFEAPTGILVPQVGSGGSGTGTVKITGGTGRFEGAKGVFSPLTGNGTATGATTASIVINGTGSLVVQQYVMPQMVYGGGWYSALYFSNTNSSTQSYFISYFANDGTPLNVPGFGTTTPVTISGNGTVRLEYTAPGPLVQGYATVNLPAGVTGYGVFRQSVQGIQDQEAVVPFANAAATQAVLTFDETNFTTAAAVVNTGSTATTVTVKVFGISGQDLGTATIPLPAKNKTAVALRSLTGLSGIIGTRGTATFTVPAGASVSVLGLRFFGSAFTSIPAVEK
ncbi:MAG: hypothetical protein ABIR70_18770 [Bryobacteraceae bacterium]